MHNHTLMTLCDRSVTSEVWQFKCHFAKFKTLLLRVLSPNSSFQLFFKSYFGTINSLIVFKASAIRTF